MKKAMLVAAGADSFDPGLPGDRVYGIPHPGIFVVTPAGRIVGKPFVDAYEKRVLAAAAVDYALARLNADSRG